MDGGRAWRERSWAAEAVSLPLTRHAGQDDGPAVELLNRILEYAAVTRASDIHIDPYELETLVRCRIDGMLQEIMSLSPQTLPPLVSRIQILSGVGIGEQ